MMKTLIKHGDSLALVIDKQILDKLHISADTPLDITSNDGVLTVSPVRDNARQKKLHTSLEKINNTYGEDLRRLGE